LHLDFPERFPEISLKAEERSNVAMMFKESLRNIVQHAGASELRLRLECRSQSLEITIEDNGQDFACKMDDPARSSNGNLGNGLRNLRARTLEMDGQLKIETRPGNGTILRISLPLARLRAD
jgi:two-component system sensor histidine kinase UhpB